MKNGKEPVREEFPEEYIGSVHSATIKRILTDDSTQKDEPHKKYKRFLHKKR